MAWASSRPYAEDWRFDPEKQGFVLDDTISYLETQTANDCTSFAYFTYRAWVSAATVGDMPLLREYMPFVAYTMRRLDENHELHAVALMVRKDVVFAWMGHPLPVGQASSQVYSANRPFIIEDSTFFADASKETQFAKYVHAKLAKQRCALGHKLIVRVKEAACEAAEHDCLITLVGRPGHVAEAFGWPSRGLGWTHNPTSFVLAAGAFDSLDKKLGASFHSLHHWQRFRLLPIDPDWTPLQVNAVHNILKHERPLPTLDVDFGSAQINAAFAKGCEALLGLNSSAQPQNEEDTHSAYIRAVALCDPQKVGLQGEALSVNLATLSPTKKNLASLAKFFGEGAIVGVQADVGGLMRLQVKWKPEAQPRA